MVIRIAWIHAFCGGGEVDLAYMPSSVRELDLLENMLEGSIASESLSPNLVYLVLGRKGFAGSVSFSALPKGLQHIPLI